jgi:hypothetical protein
MRNNSTVAALIGVLFVCGLVTVWISLRFVFSALELQKIEAHALAINKVRNATQGLANDCLEYSKRNPAILPVLQPFLTMPKPATQPPTVHPPNKPPGK